MINRNIGVKRPSTIVIVSLLLCHLAQGVIVIPSYILKRVDFDEATLSKPVCDTFRLSYMLTNYLVCLTLLLITVDRMLAVKKPLLYRSMMTNRKMVYTIICCWIYTVVLCCIPFIPESGHNSKCSYIPQNEWTLVMLTCNTMLPFIVILYCYFAIFKSARRSRKFRSRSLQGNSRRSQLASRGSELHIAKTSSFVASAYVVCWGPSFVYYLLVATCNSCFRAAYMKSEAEPIVTFTMKYLTFLNGIINPVIYCLAHKNLSSRNSSRRSNAVRGKQRTLTAELSLASVQSAQRQSTASQSTTEERL